jgi:SAM-dependent methyltransferase
MTDRSDLSRRFWDRAASENAAWYVATGFTSEDEGFFRSGATETDALLALCGVPVGPEDAVLEIGCGVGRMTRRLSELAGQVIAVDVSTEMLNRCRTHLADRGNVEYLQVPGDGHLAGVADGSVQVVFSYITLQHVPSADAQLRYLSEGGRVLAPGGRMAIQVRALGPAARLLDWSGHVHHLMRGRSTLSRAWRGARLPDAGIREHLERAGVEARILVADRRHRWVVGQKRG